MATFMPHMNKFTPKQYAYIMKKTLAEVKREHVKAYYHDWINDVWYYEHYITGEMIKIKNF